MGLGRGLLLGSLATFMVVAGLNHFRVPELYDALVPNWLPQQRALTYITGIMETGFGIALLVPQWRSWAAWGTVATLIVVFPANIAMAISGGLSDPALPRAFANPTLAWARLPIQFLLIWWAWVFTDSR